MDYLGLFSLGAFVGTIASLGVRYIKDVDQWQKVLAAVLPAVLSGVALAFVDRFKYSPAIGCYPLGLVVALMWTYADVGVANFVATDGKGKNAIGFLHLAASTVVTVAGAILVVIPAVIQVHAEYLVSGDDRVKLLAEERKKSLESPPDTSKNTKPGAQVTPDLKK